ncbi:MAG: hypothetical protein M1837_003538 [Sclerophora amabilis]|nr:MAG: hypothetical protein M1837_003538 [Sclerophora amabilis]
MRLIEKLQQRFELYKLEQRYTRRGRRPTAFISEAQYVDGEYVNINVTEYYEDAGPDGEQNRYQSSRRKHQSFSSPNLQSQSYDSPRHFQRSGRNRSLLDDTHDSSLLSPALMPAPLTSSPTAGSADKNRDRVRLRELVSGPKKSKTIVNGGGRDRESVMMMGGVRPIVTQV